MYRTVTLFIIVLQASPALGDTLHELIRNRAAATEQNFEDDPASALPKIPWVTQTETRRSLSGDLGVTRFTSSDVTSKEFGAGLFGQLHYSKLEQPDVVGMWGQSWELGLDTGFGADGTRYYGRGSATANFGTMATLSAARHAFYLRFAANLASFRDSSDSYSLGKVSIPMGFRFELKGATLELGGVPALGWASVLHNGQETSSGPLFFGAEAKVETKVGYLELERLFAASPADADQTALHTCGRYRQLVLCAEGTWLRLRDIGRGDSANFARVGINIGFGSWQRRTERSERKWVAPETSTR